MVKRRSGVVPQRPAAAAAAATDTPLARAPRHRAPFPVCRMAAAAAAAAAADALRGLEVGPAPGAAAAAQAVDAVQAAAPLEDDEDDSESDDDAAAFGAAQCLPVGSSADTLSYDRASPAAAAEPTTAEEYLRRVRYEAAQLPDITVATREQIQAGGRSPRQQHGSAAVSLTRIRTSDGRALTAMLPPSMPTVPPSVRASQTWEVAFLADFSELRLQAAEARAKGLGEEVSGGGVPPSDDGNAWQARLSGEMDGRYACASVPARARMPALRARARARARVWCAHAHPHEHQNAYTRTHTMQR